MRSAVSRCISSESSGWPGSTKLRVDVPEPPSLPHVCPVRTEYAPADVDRSMPPAERWYEWQDDVAQSGAKIVSWRYDHVAGRSAPVSQALGAASPHARTTAARPRRKTIAARPRRDNVRRSTFITPLGVRAARGVA